MIRQENITVATYVLLIKKGKMTLENVPETDREKVQQFMGEGV